MQRTDEKKAHRLHHEPNLFSQMTPPYKHCAICSSLADRESASQKFGWEQNDTYLPAAVAHLETVKDFRPGGSRKLQLLQCPACKTYYLYQTDYDYLVNGSEDEQTLTRLAPLEAEEVLRRPTP